MDPFQPVALLLLTCILERTFTSVDGGLMREQHLPEFHWARHGLPLFAVLLLGFGARSAHSQSVTPSPGDSARPASAASLDTVRVSVLAPSSRSARVRSLIVGNRLLARELARYDRRIVELEKKLDSLKAVAAERWKVARGMEDAALAAREERVAMERRLALAQASDSIRSRAAATAGPR